MESLFWRIARYILGLFMIFAGVQHFIKPDFYVPFVPSFLPLALVIVYISGVIEIVLGLAIVWTKYARWGALGIFVLMLLFLPIHIWDVFSETPVVGSHTAALIRLPFQFIFIAWAWKIYRDFSNFK